MVVYRLNKQIKNGVSVHTEKALQLLRQSGARPGHVQSRDGVHCVRAEANNLNIEYALGIITDLKKSSNL